MFWGIVQSRKFNHFVVFQPQFEQISRVGIATNACDFVARMREEFIAVTPRNFKLLLRGLLVMQPPPATHPTDLPGSIAHPWILIP